MILATTSCNRFQRNPAGAEFYFCSSAPRILDDMTVQMGNYNWFNCHRKTKYICSTSSLHTDGKIKCRPQSQYAKAEEVPTLPASTILRSLLDFILLVNNMNRFIIKLLLLLLDFSRESYKADLTVTGSFVLY